MEAIDSRPQDGPRRGPTPTPPLKLHRQRPWGRSWPAFFGNQILQNLQTNRTMTYHKFAINWKTGYVISHLVCHKTDLHLRCTLRSFNKLKLAIYGEFFPIKTVIFHSYVSLPEGMRFLFYLGNFIYIDTCTVYLYR